MTESQESSTDPAALMDRFRLVVAGGDRDIDLAEAALLLAAIDLPGAALQAARRHLHALTAAPPQEGRPDHLDDRSAWIRTVLYDRFGYTGDTDDYDAIENANLISVIARRRGIPVTLAVLALHLARSRGWAAEGVNFPGHFLIRLEADGQRIILDPFNRLAPMPVDALRALIKGMAGPDAELAAHHYAAADNRAILLRIQNNIVMRAGHYRDWPRAARAAAAMVELAPDNADLWCQLAGTQVQGGQFKSAMMTLQEGLARLDAPVDRDRLGNALASLRQRLN